MFISIKKIIELDAIVRTVGLEPTPARSKLDILPRLDDVKTILSVL